MKKIVFIGCSPAIVTAIEMIRASDQSSEITVISPEGFLPYEESKINGFLAQQCTFDDVLVKPDEFFDKHRVKFILGKKAIRYSLRKNRVTTEDKEQVEFDILILTASSDIRFPEIKGVNKEDVYSIKRLADMKRIAELLPIKEMFVVEANTLEGFQTAITLTKQNKDVSLVTRKQYLLEGMVSQNVSEYIKSCFEEAGRQVIEDNEITEVLGETDAKAVRLKSGKVLASQAMLFDETTPDMRLFKDSVLEVDEHIKTDQNYQTNLEHVFACDQMTDTHDEPSVENQGNIIGAKITGQECSLTSFIKTQSIDFNGLNLKTAGKVAEGEHITIEERFDEENKTYRRLYVENGGIVGAVYLNSNDGFKEIVKLIEKKENISERLSELLGSNGASGAPTGAEAAYEPDSSIQEPQDLSLEKEKGIA